MYPSLEEVKKIAASGEYRRIPVCRELYADRYTPVEVLRTLRGSSRHCYLLESASQTESWGRYSFLGCHPTLELNLTDGELTIRRTAEARIGAKTQEAEAGKTDATDASETVEVRKVTHPGEALREILKDYKSPVLEGLPPFTGGPVPFIGGSGGHLTRGASSDGPLRRRRGHGSRTHEISHFRRTVSSRIGDDARWETDDRKFYGGSKMIKEAILKLAKKENLTYEEAEAVMNEIMSGEATPVQMSSYLTALSLKGETIDEITASAAGMRAHCVKLLHDMDVLEIVGTGGDGSNSFNISTTASMVIAAGGVPVAKHGNRAASSKSGAADVLEALGVNITISPEKSAELLKKINICFLFAQNYHIAMKYVAPIRKELGIRTVFNILGPLSNPAGANMELMGVFDGSLVEPLAQVMENLGVTKGMVVYGQDKLDEISMCAPTSVCEIRDGKFTSYEIAPEQFGYTRCKKDALKGGTPQENAEITRNILNGADKGPKRQAVCLNAGVALYIAGKAETMEQGVRIAEELIDSGAAQKKLEEFVNESNAE